MGGEGGPTKEELQLEVAKLDEEYRRLDAQIEGLPDGPERGHLVEQRARLKLAIDGILMDIRELGGAPTEPSGTEAAGTGAAEVVQPPSSEVEAFLPAPSPGMDTDLARLVEELRDLQERIVKKALEHQDDWTCAVHGGGPTHTGCALNWDGIVGTLLNDLRKKLAEMIDHLAGVRTLEEIAAQNLAAETTTRRIKPLEADIARLEARIDELLELLESYDGVVDSLNKAGGQLATGTGALTAGREMVIYRIEEARKQLHKLEVAHSELRFERKGLEDDAKKSREERGAAEIKRLGGEIDWSKYNNNTLLPLLLNAEQKAFMEREGKRRRDAIIESTGQGSVPPKAERDVRVAAGNGTTESNGARSKVPMVVAAVIVAVFGGVAIMAVAGGSSDPKEDASAAVRPGASATERESPPVEEELQEETVAAYLVGCPEGKVDDSGGCHSRTKPLVFTFTGGEGACGFQPEYTRRHVVTFDGFKVRIEQTDHGSKIDVFRGRYRYKDGTVFVASNPRAAYRASYRGKIAPNGSSEGKYKFISETGCSTTWDYRWGRASYP